MSGDSGDQGIADAVLLEAFQALIQLQEENECMVDSRFLAASVTQDGQRLTVSGTLDGTPARVSFELCHAVVEREMGGAR